MPNYCNFSCRITGPKKGIDRFIQAAQTDYTVGEPNEPEHFWRVFEFYLGDYEEINNGINIVRPNHKNSIRPANTIIPFMLIVLGLR